MIESLHTKDKEIARLLACQVTMKARTGISYKGRKQVLANSYHFRESVHSVRKTYLEFLELYLC